MAGVFGGSVAFAGPSGGLALTAAGPRDIFLVRRDASGAASWARRFGGAQDQSATRLLLATDETLWLGGTSTTSTSTTTGDGGGAACIPMACDSTWVTVYVGQSVSSCALIVLLVSAGRDARYQGRLLVDAGGMSAGLLLWVPLGWALPEVRTVSLIGGTRARFGA